MDVVTDLPADPQAAERVEVGEGALDNPALSAESGAVFAAASRDQWLHSERADQTVALVVVVAAVSKYDVGSASGAAALAPHGRHFLNQRDVGGVGDQIVLAARPAPVDRASSGLGAPLEVISVGVILRQSGVMTAALVERMAAGRPLGLVPAGGAADTGWPAGWRAPSARRPRGAGRDHLRCHLGLHLEPTPAGLWAVGVTAFRRFTEWTEARVWAKLHRLVLDELGARGELDSSRCAIDSVSVRALKGGS